MPRQKADSPKRIALLDEQQREQGAFDRWFARLQRSARALEKSRKRLIRLAKRITELEE